MTRVKICGITTIEDALSCAEAGADALGFIFANSPRRVSAETARSIIRSLPPFIQTVGVFVGEDPDAEDIADFAGLDALQLHSGYSEAYVLGIRRSRIILGVSVIDEQSFDSVPGLQRASAILLDTWSGESSGGTGKTFDWGLAAGADGLGKPIILAGGLEPGNAKQAAHLGFYGLDVSSGVESLPGVKDHERVRKFIEQARSAGS